MKTISVTAAAVLLAVPALRADSAAAPTIEVYLPKEDTLQVDGKTVSLEEFRAMMSAAAKRDKAILIRISAPPGVGHKMVVSLFEICRSVGLTRVLIETSLEKKS